MDNYSTDGTDLFAGLHHARIIVCIVESFLGTLETTAHVEVVGETDHKHLGRFPHMHPTLVRGIPIPIGRLHFIIVGKGIDDKDREADSLQLIIQLEELDVLPTLKRLPSELIVIGEKLIDQRPLFPLGDHFSLIPAIRITMVVIVPSVDVMIHATRQA